MDPKTLDALTHMAKAYMVSAQEGRIIPLNEVKP